MKYLYSHRERPSSKQKCSLKCLHEIVNYKVNVMVGCGMQSNTNINKITQQLEFEVVTGCSLSPRQDTEGLSTEEEGSHRLSPLQRLLQSDLSHQEPLTATSQTTTVTGEEPTRNTELKSGGLEDSLTASSKPPQQSYSADPHLYLSLELR